VILVDTSVWVDHLRSGDQRLSKLLDDGQVATHPFVIGELALGQLKRREAIMEMLDDLPKAAIATDLEVLGLIERDALFGSGIGYVDAHLLASAKLTPGVLIWTRDKHMSQIANKHGVDASAQRHA
jgi:predicted nucleic acid-binding protein